MFHSQIRLCVKRTWNVHNIYRYIEHRNLETRKTLDDFLVQVQNFFYLSLKFLRHKERDTHSFYSGFFIFPHHLMQHPPQANSLASVTKRKPTIFSRGRTQLNSLTFSKSPKSSARAFPVHDVIHIHWSTFLSDFYFDIYARHILPAHALTPALKFAPN